MKESVLDLAIFGGKKTFNHPIYIGSPNIGNEIVLKERFQQILNSKWLTNNGVFVQSFENMVASYLNVKHCIAVCNATIGLEIVAKALDLKGEVIVPSFTFIATPHSLQWQGIKPIFCDIDTNHNIDVNKLEDLISPETSAILGVHLWGRPCDIKNLQCIADNNNLKLYFDAAHAFGCSYKGTMIGNFGEAEVFSFHATKFFNTFEGGMIATNNDELAAKIRLMKNFGFSGPDNVVSIGTNGKMNEFSAAMGITSMESIHDFTEKNYVNHRHYSRCLEMVYGIKLLEYDFYEKNNYQYIVIEVDESKCGISRDLLQKLLEEENIFTRRYFYPGCHNMEPYKSIIHYDLEQTEEIAKKVLVLPNGTFINSGHIIKICNVIKFIVSNSSDIHKTLEIYYG